MAPAIRQPIPREDEAAAARGESAVRRVQAMPGTGGGDYDARISDLEEIVGEPPAPALGRTGSGISLTVTQVHAAVTRIDERDARREAAQLAREARRSAVVLWVAKIVGGALLLAAVAGLLTYLGGFHR